MHRRATTMTTMSFYFHVSRERTGLVSCRLPIVLQRVLVNVELTESTGVYAPRGRAIHT